MSSAFELFMKLVSEDIACEDDQLRLWLNILESGYEGGEKRPNGVIAVVLDGRIGIAGEYGFPLAGFGGQQLRGKRRISQWVEMNV